MTEQISQVELARFGPDENWNTVFLVRFFKDKGTARTYDLAGLEAEADDLLSALFTDLTAAQLYFSERAVFGFVECSATGTRRLLDMFAIDLFSEGDPVVSADMVNRLILISLTRSHSSELDPKVYGLLLWTLIELFGFDPDKYMSITTTFLLQLPAIVRDGALDRFRAEPVMQDLNAVIDERLSLDPWRAASASAAEQFEAWNNFFWMDGELFELGTKVLSKLALLDESLALSGKERVEDVVRGGLSLSVPWEMLIHGLEPVDISLEIPSRTSTDSTDPAFWMVTTTDSNKTLAAETDLITALETARLVMEESDWEPWYAKTVTQHAVDPKILVDIDIEPYLLLEAATPYVWPDAAFLQFLREV